jgi:predicted metalloprotease with PDZ domain
VKPYTFEDVVRTLNSVEPYDWTSFLNERLEKTSAHAPLNGILSGGYKLTYTSERSEFWKTREGVRKGINLSYSLGLSARDDGDVIDVRLDTPAFKAGLAPAMRIVAVDGRQFSPAVLREAVNDAAKSTAPLVLIAKDGEYYKTLSLDYHDGEKYPHLIRDKSKADLLGDIIRPHAAGSRPASGGSR